MSGFGGNDWGWKNISTTKSSDKDPSHQYLQAISLVAKSNGTGFQTQTPARRAGVSPTDPAQSELNFHTRWSTQLKSNEFPSQPIASWTTHPTTFYERDDIDAICSSPFVVFVALPASEWKSVCHIPPSRPDCLLSQTQSPQQSMILFI